MTIHSFNIEDKKVEERAGNDLMKLHNMFADAANPHILEWNSEWDSMHPELINKEMQEGSKEYIEYGEFWAEKCNDLYGRINEIMNEASTVIGGFMSVNGNVIELGQLKSDKTKYVILG